MHAKQEPVKSGQKSSGMATTDETAKTTKSGRTVADAQRTPAWARAWGDELPPGLRLQTKLTVSQPRERYEQEADRVAEQVMRMADSEPPVSDEEDEARNTLMRKQSAEPGANATSASSDVPPLVSDVLSSDGGQPLDTTTRAFMEPRFGYDFSQVRVHTDERATQSAQAVDALAYTVGRDVIFGKGQYAPESGKGRRLLAHELAHVVQQQSSGLEAGIAHPRQAGQEVQRGEPLTTTYSLPALMRAPQGQQQKLPAGQKTLKEEGKVSTEGPIPDDVAQIIDKVLQRNQKLSHYIGNKVKTIRTSKKEKFIIENDPTFKESLRKYIQDMCKYYPDFCGTSPEAIPALGFYNPVRHEIHVRETAKFGTALHEAIHRLSAPNLLPLLMKAMKVDKTGTLKEVLKEGVTAYFTDSVLKDEGLNIFTGSYRKVKPKAQKLVETLGFDLVAKFYFKDSKAGIYEIGRKLGLSQPSPLETLRKMNQLLEPQTGSEHPQEEKPKLFPSKKEP